MFLEVQFQESIVVKDLKVFNYNMVNHGPYELLAEVLGQVYNYSIQLDLWVFEIRRKQFIVRDEECDSFPLFQMLVWEASRCVHRLHLPRSHDPCVGGKFLVIQVIHPKPLHQDQPDCFTVVSSRRFSSSGFFSSN